MMTKEFYELVRSRLTPHGVAAFNTLPSSKLFDSTVRTLKLAFDNLDFFDSGERLRAFSNVIVVARRDRLTEDATLRIAAAAQARYHFRFDVRRLLVERRIEAPNPVKGEVLTDDFAPADYLDAQGRLYRREK
jgi:spermidine synthase